MSFRRLMPPALLLSSLLAFNASADEADEQLAKLRQEAKELQKAISERKPYSVVEMADRIQAEAQKILPMNSPERGNYLELSANVFLTVGNCDRAEDLFGQVVTIRRTSWEKARELKEKSLLEQQARLVFAHFSHGSAATHKGDYYTAARRYQAALDLLAPEVPDHDALRAALLNQLGFDAAVTRDTPVAIERLKEAVALCERAKPAQPALLAKLNRNLGEIYLDGALRVVSWGQKVYAKDSLKLAEAAFKAASTYYIKDNKPKEGLGIIETMEALRLLLSIDQLRMAEEDYQTAATHLEEMLKGYPAYMADSIGADYRQSLGYAKFALGKREEAIAEFWAALKLLDKATFDPTARPNAAIAQVKLGRGQK